MLALIAICVLIFVFSNSFWALFFLLVSIALPVISLIMLLISSKNARILLSIPAVITSAEDNKATCAFASSSRLPIPKAQWDIEIINCISGSKVLCSLSAVSVKSGHDTFSFAFQDLYAGKHIISAKNIRLFDCLGILGKKIKPSDPESCLVLPKTFPILISDIPRSSIISDSTVYSEHKTGNDVTEIFAMHEYVPGDDLRRVHWKLSSKMDNLIVRDFALPLNHSVLILLELWNQDRTDKLLSMCIETFVSLSAALIELGINHSIAWFDDSSSSFFIEEISSADLLSLHLPDILSASACTDSPLALDYCRQSRYLSSNMYIYYITSAIDSDKISELSQISRLKTILLTDAKQSLLYPEDSPLGDLTVFDISSHKDNTLIL